MGMELILAQVTPDQLKDFQSNPEGAQQFLTGDPGEGDPDRMEAIAQAVWSRMGLSPEIREQVQQQFRSMVGREAMQHLTQATGQAGAAKKPRLVKLPGRQTDRKEMSLQKDWHVLHYALNGTTEGGEVPLSFAVFGDAELVNGGGSGYGPPRYLTPEQVESVAAELQKIVPSSLLTKLNVEDAEEKNIYLAHTLDDPSDWEYLPELFCQFRDFYQNAADHGNGMMMSIT